MVAPPLLQRGDILLFLKWETTRGLPLPPPSKIYRRQLCQGFFSFCNGIFNMSLAGMMTMLERNFMFFLGKQILLKSCARFPRKVTKVNWRKKQCLLSTQQFFSFLLAIRRIFLRWQLSSPRNAPQRKGRVEESGFSFFPSIFLGKYGDAPILFLSDTKVPLSFQEAARRGETTPNFIILARLTRRNGKKKLMCPGDKKGKRSKDTLHNSEEGKRRKKTLQLLVRKKGGEGGFTFCRRLARERES